MNMLKVYDFAPQILLPDRQHGPKRGSQIQLLGLQNRPKIDQNESWEGSGEGYRKKVDFRSQILPPRPPKCSQKGTKMDPQIDQNVVKKSIVFCLRFWTCF